MSNPRDVYLERAAQQGAEAERLTSQGRWFVIARVVSSLAAVFTFLVAWIAPQSELWFGLSGFLFFVFLVLVTMHELLKRQVRQCELAKTMNDEGAARIDRRWTDWRRPAPAETPSELVGLSRDLDLFGSVSLFKLVSQAYTPLGVELTASWLLEPAAPEEVAARQAATRQLAQEVELREELALRGRLLEDCLAGPSQFLDWAEGPMWLAPRPAVRWISRLLPCVCLGSLLLTAVKVIPPGIGGSVVVAALAGNIIISIAFTGFLHDIFNRITTHSGEMQHYRAMFEVMATAPQGSAKIEHLREVAVENNNGASRQLKRLAAIMAAANVRRAGLFAAVYLLFLQLFLLWDFHIIALLERWQAENGKEARRWFMALAELEALASLATLSYDHPTWSLPKVDGALTAVESRALGHPLLAADVRVANDVVVGPAGTFLLVTGSNMSGKSTLLRSIGLNAILAQAGGPVCADELQMPPLVVTTSMRISDSLAQGVSFFMAELHRLKQIVDQAQSYAGRSDTKLLYLLDEILQGTNSVERHIAVSRVISHLLDSNAIGAVSTHDLDLAHHEQLASTCHTVHFRESFEERDGQRQMTFDYQMRSGVAPTTNALKLLELVGLPETLNGSES